MEQIFPEYKSEEEKNTLLLVAILTIIFPVIAPAVAYLGLKSLSPSSFDVVKALLNFELSCMIVVLICGIPIIGWLLAFVALPVITIAHYIITIAAALSIANNQPVNVFVPVKFIK